LTTGNLVPGKRCCCHTTSRWRRKWFLFAGNVLHISTLKCDLYGRPFKSGRNFYSLYFSFFLILPTDDCYIHTHNSCVFHSKTSNVSKSGRMRSRGHTRRGNDVVALFATRLFSSHQDKMNQSIRQLNLENISRREGNKGLIDPLLTGKPYIITNGLFDGLCIS
jgi:hypothetical protein